MEHEIIVGTTIRGWLPEKLTRLRAASRESRALVTVDLPEAPFCEDKRYCANLRRSINLTLAEIELLVPLLQELRDSLGTAVELGAGCRVEQPDFTADELAAADRALDRLA